MHLFHIPQYTIQNRNVHISVLNGALWDMKQVHCGICEYGPLEAMFSYLTDSPFAARLRLCNSLVLSCGLLSSQGSTAESINGNLIIPRFLAFEILLH